MALDPGRDHLYNLVSLQIGDMQSYVSRLYVFLACDDSKLVFLVDNGPWTSNGSRSRSAELWMLMVTKSRSSPFTNHKLKRTRSYELGNSKANLCHSSPRKRASSRNWDRVFRALRPQFQGCVAFEVLWEKVRGINYCNELQTDTCFSLETEFMTKREFDSIEEALRFYESECDRSSGGEESPETSGRTPKRAKYHDTRPYSAPSRLRTMDAETSPSPSEDTGYFTPTRLPLDGTMDAGVSPTFCTRRRLRMNTDPGGVLPIREVPISKTYKDVFVVFRFSDPILPFELKDVITADQRLLKMLESGLPSWVMFLQSYPIFSQIYRPWMRPLARTIYFAVSVVTVMIGFYDLYKNVPVLKATAAHMLGPLFQWMESWEMVSRLKYLGTMLVLQNLEKAFMFINDMRKLVSLLMKPVVEPVVTLWGFCVPVWATMVAWFETLVDFVVVVTGSVLQMVQVVLQLVVWPFSVLISALWKLGCAILYPVISLVHVLALMVEYAIQGLSDYGAGVVSGFLTVFQGIWGTIVPSGKAVIKAGSPIVASAPKTPSLWRALWDDLLSKVFRAVMYIINGFVAFFTALNRHRLSIYNNMADFMIGLALFLESQKRRIEGTWIRFRIPGSRRVEDVKEE